MPVILPREAYAVWLDPTLTDPQAARALLRPLPAEHLHAWPVSRRVNRPANDDPALLEEVDAGN
jgi:putative SOS response-associated peptidase YedK